RHLEGQPAEQFDVVFLDPPFHQGLLPTACALLEERNWLADEALVLSLIHIGGGGVGVVKKMWGGGGGGGGGG
ncbi:RsmD family RNA methyltransferase, partial [Pseudomonas sp. CCC3.2]|nr:RsmD family RNA methyltransferase [Pseudomonas sp. CCC3.2]